MVRLVLPVLCLASLVAAMSAGEPPNGAKPDEIWKKFYGCWLEVERVDAGRATKDPSDLCGVQFAEKEYWVWPRRGELSAGGGTTYRVRIDPAAEPMRVDIFSGTRAVPPGKWETVQAGIFKFDGDKLTVAVAPWAGLAPPDEGKDYPTRPKAFESTKENKVTLSTYTPTAFWAVD